MTKTTNDVLHTLCMLYGWFALLLAGIVVAGG